MVKKQNFTPAWASTEIYGNMDDGGAHATIMFTIPEDCPTEALSAQGTACSRGFGCAP